MCSQSCCQISNRCAAKKHPEHTLTRMYLTQGGLCCFPCEHLHTLTPICEITQLLHRLQYVCSTKTGSTSADLCILLYLSDLWPPCKLRPTPPFTCCGVANQEEEEEESSGGAPGTGHDEEKNAGVQLLMKSKESTTKKLKKSESGVFFPSRADWKAADFFSCVHFSFLKSFPPWLGCAQFPNENIKYRTKRAVSETGGRVVLGRGLGSGWLARKGGNSCHICDVLTVLCYWQVHTH